VKRRVRQSRYTPHRTKHESAPWFATMKDHVYKTIELTGTSSTTIEDAVNKALKRAHKTIKGLSWFQIIETRGSVDKGQAQQWQVTLKVGFIIQDT
jgi:flavin-binding protein dodecin